MHHIESRNDPLFPQVVAPASKTKSYTPQTLKWTPASGKNTTEEFNAVIYHRPNPGPFATHKAASHDVSKVFRKSAFNCKEGDSR